MAVRKAALLVGIDDYQGAPLRGCVRDAQAMEELLAKNEDGSPNFYCHTLIAPAQSDGKSTLRLTRARIREQLAALLNKKVDIALFYFSGHGLVTARGGFLVTQDAQRSDEGIGMEEILHLVNESEIKEVVVILDCCHSGKFGDSSATKESYALLREGRAVLAASLSAEGAVELAGVGVFSALVCEALRGGASDLIGQVTVSSVYAYVEQALGPWDQRPVFKANLARLDPLRVCKPIVKLATLRQLTSYFPTADYDYPLDPSYERDEAHRPAGSVCNPAHEYIFGHLQELRAADLVVPVDEEHMFWAAIRSKSCRLTARGRYYWKLVKDNRL